MGSLCNSIVHQIWHRVACATNCFAHAHTIALCMFAQLLCACPIYTSHRHAHAIALHMRKPLLCTCASHYFAHARPIALHMRKPLLCTCAPHCSAHARPIIPHTSTIRKHATGSTISESEERATSASESGLFFTLRDSTSGGGSANPRPISSGFRKQFGFSHLGTWREKTCFFS